MNTSLVMRFITAVHNINNDLYNFVKQRILHAKHVYFITQIRNLIFYLLTSSSTKYIREGILILFTNYLANYSRTYLINFQYNCLQNNMHWSSLETATLNKLSSIVPDTLFIEYFNEHSGWNYCSYTNTI